LSPLGLSKPARHLRPIGARWSAKARAQQGIAANVIAGSATVSVKYSPRRALQGSTTRLRQLVFSTFAAGQYLRTTT
jgi:hypothetical protein